MYTLIPYHNKHAAPGISFPWSIRPWPLWQGHVVTRTIPLSMGIFSGVSGFKPARKESAPVIKPTSAEEYAQINAKPTEVQIPHRNFFRTKSLLLSIIIDYDCIEMENDWMRWKWKFIWEEAESGLSHCNPLQYILFILALYPIPALFFYRCKIVTSNISIAKIVNTNNSSIASELVS